MAPAILTLLILLAGSPVERTPDLIKAADSLARFPIWVSLSQAFGPGGTVNTNLFEPSAQHKVLLHTHRIQHPTGTNAPGVTLADPCEKYTTIEKIDRADPKPNRSLSALAKHAKAIYGGTLEELTEGFLRGRPGSLLRVSVERTLRPSPEFKADDSVFVFYPYLRATVGEHRVCSTDPSFTYRPSIGDQVLVFAYLPPWDDLRRLIVPEATEIAFESKDNRIWVGPGVMDPDLSEVRTLRDLESATRSRLAEDAPPDRSRE